MAAPALLPPSASTRRYSARQDALVSAASTLFNVRGVAGTSLAEVAASVGLAKNSITYYYKRKEELVVACFERALRSLCEQVDQAAAEPTVAARVRRLVCGQAACEMRELQGQRPPTVQLQELRALPEPHRTEVFTRYLDMYRRVRALLRSPETDRWSHDDLNARAHLLVSYVLSIKGLASRYQAESFDGVAAGLADIVLHGIHAPSSRWLSRGVEAQWQGLAPDRDHPAEQFLRVATELINECGYGGASVNRIAEKLHVTKGAFYYYNENKGDLASQCFDRFIQTIRRYVNLAEQHGGPAWEQLGAVVRGLVCFQLSPDGPLLRSFVYSAIPEPQERMRMMEEYGRLTERLAGMAVNGMLDGSVRVHPPTLAARALLYGVFAAAELRLWVGGAGEGNVADLLARPMLQGLLCEARGAQPVSG
ncbi:MAG: TetR/AcrR family transcriptional regulator [Acidovorax sp.]